MKPPVRKPALEAAAAHMRAMSLSSNAGAFVGAEDALIAQLGVSRVTIRQAARLLEREGLLTVKRGANGGYFSARPDAQTIEGVLSSYIEALRFDIEETFVVGFALWLEAVRQAARLKTPEARSVTEGFRKRLASLPADAPIYEIVALENDYRHAIFQLAKLPYLELIFQLNRAVTWRYYAQPPWADGSTTLERDFVRAWRDAKLAELTALEQGEEDATIQAAIRDRELWQQRLFASGITKRNL